MVYTSIYNSSSLGSPILLSDLLKWLLLICLASVVVILFVKVVKNLSRSNALFYSEKDAINLRIGSMPELLVATTNCNSFHIAVYGNKLIVYYYNPFNEIREFQCELVGASVKRGFVLDFTEENFKRVCFNLKPGKVAIWRNRISFNYKFVVPVSKFRFIK